MAETKTSRGAESPNVVELRAPAPQERPGPTALEPSPRQPPRRRRLMALALLAAVAGAAGGWFWWQAHQARLPPGIAWGNGRIEADQVDIDTKFAGRIAKLSVDEGDMVKPGQVVAVMDTRDLEAQLKQYRQLVRQDRRTLEQAKANYSAQQAVVTLARQQVERAAYLVPKGYATQEMLDQRRQQLSSAVATQNAGQAAIDAAEHALAAAEHQVDFYQVNIADNSLVAPKEGPIEYRVANVGEVLPAGGKVFTMLDASYVYMDIYLPTKEAGRVRIGSAARIVLDAYSEHVIPAKVVFVASQAQFTPKTVETKDEREKLMFRIRVRLDPQRLEGRAGLVRSGLPGVAYVLTDAHASWPANLQPSAPPSPTAARP